ncbi:hypothetical protein WJX72_012478 [[Myrmecia] bisecta]|uniref:Uncharacterized protein n=1 Tax=[Myrmecia] bisecta TaxID=41462 RepID=A0AAW1PDB7_9CHLO
MVRSLLHSPRAIASLVSLPDLSTWATPEASAKQVTPADRDCTFSDRVLGTLIALYGFITAAKDFRRRRGSHHIQAEWGPFT